MNAILTSVWETLLLLGAIAVLVLFLGILSAIATPIQKKRRLAKAKKAEQKQAEQRRSNEVVPSQPLLAALGNGSGNSQGLSWKALHQQRDNLPGGVSTFARMQQTPFREATRGKIAFCHAITGSMPIASMAHWHINPPGDAFLVF